MVAHIKAALRKKMLGLRDSLPPGAQNSFSVLIEESLFSRPRFQEAGCVAFYLPKGSEVDTRKMISRALSAGKEVLLPITDHEINLFRFNSFDDLKPGRFGIMEPLQRIPPSKEPDVIVVPGVSFGLCMHRLGYGKGYDDRFLSRSPAFRIGVCFDFQLELKLPTHEDDERMDEIITEKRVITL